jgi:hypothetical protein
MTECPDCLIPLVEELPAEGEQKYEPVYVELATALESSDPGEIMIVKSLLEDAGIRYYAKGEGIQYLFGGGTFGTGFNSLTGPIQIQVSIDDLAKA